MATLLDLMVHAIGTDSVIYVDIKPIAYDMFASK